MNNIDDIQRRIKNKKNSKKESTSHQKKSNKIKVFFIKSSIILCIFIICTVLCKINPQVKNKIYNYVYNKNISFSSIKKFYNDNIGNIIPFENIFKEKKVFSEKLTYENLSTYNKGVKLKLSDNYAIPIIKGGIVIFVGDKEKLGKTVIIQQSDGIDVWYGNLSNVNMKLYDYVSDNDIVGEAKNNELYLQFQKDGVDIDYKEVLK